MSFGNSIFIASNVNFDRKKNQNFVWAAVSVPFSFFDINTKLLYHYKKFNLIFRTKVNRKRENFSFFLKKGPSLIDMPFILFTAFLFEHDLNKIFQFNGIRHEKIIFLHCACSLLENPFCSSIQPKLPTTPQNCIET